MKKLISFFLCFFTVVSLVMPVASALFDSGAVTSQLDSEIYYLENLDEGTVFFEKNSTQQTPAAGFVKVLAAVVALEKWGNLDGDVKITEKNLNLLEYEYGMITALYEEGEVVSRRELFDCLVVYSANDALSIIASEVSGSLEAFIAEMQKLTEKIGCTSTVIKNIHGFDEEGQYTTAQDVAKIIKYALNFPVFVEAFSASEVVLKQTEKNEVRTYTASNKMKNAAIEDYYHESVTGGKQTSTDLAGECIAVISSDDGYSYLAVVMQGRMEDIDNDDYDENTSMTDTKKMLNWVYENIRYRVIANPDQTVATVDVVAGKGAEKLRLVPEKETSALVPSLASPASVKFEFVDGKAPESIVAPVEAGDIITQANVYYADQKLTTVNIVAAETVKLSFAGLVLNFIRSVIGSIPFLVITLIAAIIAVVRFALDVKDFFDKDRKKSYEPQPSSFEQLVEKIKKALTFGEKKKKQSKSSGKKPAPQSRKGTKKSAPAREKKASPERKAPSKSAKAPAQRKEKLAADRKKETRTKKDNKMNKQ